MGRHRRAKAPLADSPALDSTLPDVAALSKLATLLVPTDKPYQVEMLKCTFCEEPETKEY